MLVSRFFILSIGALTKRVLSRSTQLPKRITVLTKLIIKNCTFKSPMSRSESPFRIEKGLGDQTNFNFTKQSHGYTGVNYDSFAIPSELNSPGPLHTAASLVFSHSLVSLSQNSWFKASKWILRHPDWEKAAHPVYCFFLFQWSIRSSSQLTSKLQYLGFTAPSMLLSKTTEAYGP